RAPGRKVRSVGGSRGLVFPPQAAAIKPQFLAQVSQVSPAYVIALLAVASIAAEVAFAAQPVPLPRPRPAEADEPPAAEPAPPSACRLRLTPTLAVAPSLPAAPRTHPTGAHARPPPQPPP